MCSAPSRRTGAPARRPWREDNPRKWAGPERRTSTFQPSPRSRCPYSTFHGTRWHRESFSPHPAAFHLLLAVPTTGLVGMADIDPLTQLPVAQPVAEPVAQPQPVAPQQPMAVAAPHVPQPVAQLVAAQATVATTALATASYAYAEVPYEAPMSAEDALATAEREGLIMCRARARTYPHPHPTPGRNPRSSPRPPPNSNFSPRPTLPGPARRARRGSAA